MKHYQSYRYSNYYFHAVNYTACGNVYTQNHFASYSFSTYKCFVSPHCYYSIVVKETGKLYAVIVEQPTKKENHCWITLKAKAETQQLLERANRCWETNHIWNYHG